MVTTIGKASGDSNCSHYAIEIVGLSKRSMVGIQLNITPLVMHSRKSAYAKGAMTQGNRSSAGELITAPVSLVECTLKHIPLMRYGSRICLSIMLSPIETEAAKIKSSRHCERRAPSKTTGALQYMCAPVRPSSSRYRHAQFH